MAENNAINKQTEDLVVNKASGDPYVNFQIGGTDEFVIGVDDDDSDALKINQGGASPSAGTNVWKMSAAGERIMPLQPAFGALLSAADTNATGAGTIETVPFDTEEFDQGGDFNTGTYTFTAPVDGKYIFSACLSVADLGASADNYRSRFVFSNALGNEDIFYFGSVTSIKSSNNVCKMAGSRIAEMDAADTIYMAMQITGMGGDTASIQTGSWFCGVLSV